MRQPPASTSAPPATRPVRGVRTTDPPHGFGRAWDSSGSLFEAVVCVPLTPALSLRACHYRQGGVPFLNPKGIASSSPGLRGTSYPGLGSRIVINPERVGARHRFLASRARSGHMLQPLQGWRFLAPITPRVARASQPWAQRQNPFGIHLWPARDVANSKPQATGAGTKGNWAHVVPTDRGSLSPPSR